jgi:hypothetical protein
MKCKDCGKEFNCAKSCKEYNIEISIKCLCPDCWIKVFGKLCVCLDVEQPFSAVKVEFT